MKYIDAEKLKRFVGELKEQAKRNHCDTWGIVPNALEEVEGFITSLQQEHPELPPIEYAETYYQKGLYDGIIKGKMEIIKRLEEIEKRKADPVIVIKQQEQPEVDLKEEIAAFFSKNPIPHEHITDWPLLKNTAIHFYELGKLNARK